MPWRVSVRSAARGAALAGATCTTPHIAGRWDVCVRSIQYVGANCYALFIPLFLKGGGASFAWPHHLINYSSGSENRPIRSKGIDPRRWSAIRKSGRLCRRGARWRDGCLLRSVIEVILKVDWVEEKENNERPCLVCQKGTQSYSYSLSPATALYSTRPSTVSSAVPPVPNP